MLDGREIGVAGADRPPAGGFTDEAGRPLAAAADADLARLLTVAALVNDASLQRRPDGVVLHGDPTETALLSPTRPASSPRRSAGGGRAAGRSRSTRRRG